MVAARECPSVTNDRELERKISGQLAESTRPMLRALDVRVIDGCVLLRGRLGSFYEVQLAIQSCQQLAGTERKVDIADLAVRN